jgi:hypothetical protein
MEAKSEKFMPSEYDQYLSFLDLEEHPDWMAAWKAQDKEKVEEILYSMGCEIDAGYEIEVLMHRSRITQKVDYGPRVSYMERQDRVWKESGMSIEDQIRNCGDISLQNMLSGMNKFGFGKCDTVKTVEQLASEL